MGRVYAATGSCTLDSAPLADHTGGRLFQYIQEFRVKTRRQMVAMVLAAGVLFGGQIAAETIEVGGEAEDGYVFGALEVDADGNAIGTLQSTEGHEVQFAGKLTAGGEIVGTDQDGNEYDLEID